MTEENNVENLILHQLRALDAKVDKGFAELKGEIASVREDAAARDEENARVLAQILQHTANVNELLIDLQARVVRNEKRVTALEEARPEA